MRLLIRIIIVLALFWLGYVLVAEMKSLWAIPADSADYDPTKMIVSFIVMIGMAVVVAVVLAITLLPKLGDMVGHFMFNPDESIEKDPHADAVVAVAKGEYGEAIALYKHLVHKNPQDMHAISEAAMLQCEKLEDYDGAAEFLHDFLEEERPPEETAFLAERLVDIYWNYQKDHEKALPILQQLVDTMPGTNHSANAYHRIRDIETALGEKHAVMPSEAQVAHDADQTPASEIETTSETSEELKS